MTLNLRNKTVPLTAFSVLNFMAGMVEIPFISTLLPQKYYMVLAASSAAAAGILRTVWPTMPPVPVMKTAIRNDAIDKVAEKVKEEVKAGGGEGPC